MAGGSRKVNVEVALSGEAKYKQAISELNAANKTMGAELKRLSEEFRGNSDSLDFLTQKGESPEAAAAAVDWLCEKGLLDDGRYAGMVVRHYAGKGYGQSRVRQELQRRGVPRELWEEALRELPEPEDKLDAYLASKLKDPDDRAQVQKVSAALIRRGFSWEEIRAALARYRDGMEE